MKLAVNGATGRMGKAIVRLAAAAPDIELVGASAEPEMEGRDIGELAGVGTLGVAVSADVGAALAGADVAIDFSLPAAVRPFLHAAVAERVPVVVGTTGLTLSDEEALQRASEKIGVLWARNMSLGVHVLAELVQQAVARLGADYDVEILDIHHRAKVDAPSGTALRLADAARAARPELEPLLARSGQVGKRSDTELGVFGLRGGDVAGDHTVFLLGPGERLELTHRATNREVFAHGALRAARWMCGRAAGRYEIGDVLGAP